MEQLGELSISISDEKPTVCCAYMKVQPELLNQIQVQQSDDVRLNKILVDIEKFTPLGYSQRGNGLLLFQGRICILDVMPCIFNILKS